MTKKKTEEAAPLRDPRDFIEHPPRGSMQYRDFDSFWFVIGRELNLDASVKPQLWTYFRSIGILNEPKQYRDGLKKFGLGN
jgi:hypothetical protein